MNKKLFNTILTIKKNKPRYHPCFLEVELQEYFGG